MKIERLREQMELLNKVDGKTYKVISVQNNTGLAKEWNYDTEEFGDASVNITETNALAFRILSDPLPYPVPEGYDLENGKLVKDGLPVCEQGQLLFNKILAKGAGYLVLSSETQMEDFIDLYIYDFAKDRFTKLISRIPDVSFVGYANDTDAVFAYCKIADEERKDGDKTETIQVFKEARVFSVCEGRVSLSREFSCPISVDKILIAEKPEGYELFIPSNACTEDDGVLKDRKHLAWYHVTSGCCSYVLEADTLSANWSPLYKEFVLTGPDFVYVLSKDLKITSKKIEELKDFPILIDVTKEDYAYKLTFSDKDLNFKTLTSQSTKDRGYIVSVK